MLVILLILLIFGFGFGGSYYNNGQFRGPGFGLGAILLIVVLFLLLGGGSLGHMSFCR